MLLVVVFTFVSVAAIAVLCMCSEARQALKPGDRKLLVCVESENCWPKDDYVAAKNICRLDIRSV